MHRYLWANYNFLNIRQKRALSFSRDSEERGSNPGGQPDVGHCRPASSIFKDLAKGKLGGVIAAKAWTGESEENSIIYRI